MLLLDEETRNTINCVIKSIHINKYIKMKVVVFDLDETLGYFVEFGIFWDCLTRQLNEISSTKLTQEVFNDILDLYPEFLRPNIHNILNYLKTKKINGSCEKVMIYTNNQGPKSWAQQLVHYFESKLKYNLFDQIVCAFKINGRRIEPNRTSHDKSYHDLLNCSNTKIPSNAEICFLDDNYFPEMSHDNVYYIYVKPYKHDLEYSDMTSRLTNSRILEYGLQEEEELLKRMRTYSYSFNVKREEEYEEDKKISKDILSYLRLFFNFRSKNKTFKKKTAKKANKTARRY
jgi:hypothetical protein